MIVTYIGRSRNGIVALDCVRLSAGQDDRTADLRLGAIGNGRSLWWRLFPEANKKKRKKQSQVTFK